MDLRRLSRLLLLAGLALMLAAFAWWYLFYSAVMRDLSTVGGGAAANGSVFDAISCLFSSGGACAVAAGLAVFTGRTPYQPTIFWIGAALVIGAIVIIATAKPAKNP